MNKTRNVLINVALRCFRVTVVAMEEQGVTYSECVYSISSAVHKSACAMLSLYCRLRTVQLYQIFPHYLMNGAILGKKLLDIKCVLIFCIAFILNIPHSKKK